MKTLSVETSRQSVSTARQANCLKAILASSLTLSDPLNVPAAVGWNGIVSVQLVKAATLVPQPLTE